MSLEDDMENSEVELRDLATQTLEENGLLSKIRAQLRAGLYLALESDLNISDSNLKYNNTLKSKLANPEISTVFCLIREFLEYFELNFTKTVFEKETFMGTAYFYEGREKLIQDLDIGIDTLHHSPLLLEILNVARSSFNFSTKHIDHENKFNTTNINTTNINTTNIEDSRELNNATYEIPSYQDKSDHSNSNEALSPKNESLSESSANEGLQHVTEFKAILKEKNETADENLSTISKRSKDQNSSKEVSESISLAAKKLQEIESSNRSSVTKSRDETDRFEQDDTYEGTSSIAEDSVVSVNKEQTLLIDFDKSVKVPGTPKMLDQTMEESPKVCLSPEQSHSEKKSLKLDKSERIEKLKPMSGLSSLSDLPPLQLNKSRSPDTVLLPSLYSKDFREKSSLKEIDKLLDINFDSMDNYEEDFMSSCSLNNEEAKSFVAGNTLNVNKMKESRKERLSPEQPVRKSDMNKKNSKEEDEKSKASKVEDIREGSGTSSVSEDFDLNSNIDDILKSSSTN